MAEIRNLTQNIKYLDRSEASQTPAEIEKLLRLAPINTFSCNEGIIFKIISKNY
jgi:hypothetical protein